MLGAGAAVVVFNRTRERAEKMVEDLRGVGPTEAGELGGVGQARSDALVNGTPIGMRGGPAPKDVPFAVDQLGRGVVVMDTVYNPLRTPLLNAAEKAGLKTVDGLCMFVRQAALQFEAWTGKPAPLSLFDRVARESLSAGGGA